MKLALVGFGRLGKLLSRNLSQDFDLAIYEKSKNIDIPENYQRIDIDELKDYPIILLTIPVNQIQYFCQQVKKVISPRTLLIDTCSVKVYPIKKMDEILGQNIQILGTHPMFGPDSAKDTLWGNKIVLCPQRVEPQAFSNIKKYLERHGLKTITTTAEVHDKEIAQSLALTHFIGRGLIGFGASELEIDTKGHRRLMKILETVENDTIELFIDMNKYNPYAQQMRATFLNVLKKIDTDLQGGSS